jgi:hypothetical protein
LLGKDVEAEVLEGFLGYDPHLDTAINLALDEGAEIDEDDDEGNDEDEDY